ncbi:hypothetical protein [Leptospira noguchii]|uniref:hypothetical protein n=2 Tax=Leptospira noguchii TaxID=28182 RepID=UPI003261892F
MSLKNSEGIGAKSAVVSHFNYEICELRRRPIGSRCIEFIIRPNFLTSNSRFLRNKFVNRFR